MTSHHGKTPEAIPVPRIPIEVGREKGPNLGRVSPFFGPQEGSSSVNPGDPLMPEKIIIDNLKKLSIITPERLGEPLGDLMPPA